ncbi:MAG TPA: hypothetical protein VMH85_08740 [Terriglobales bacterium]|nr:hypothetical protein [Terriglobales bacterium]
MQRQSAIGLQGISTMRLTSKNALQPPTSCLQTGVAAAPGSLEHDSQLVTRANTANLFFDDATQ